MIMILGSGWREHDGPEEHYIVQSLRSIIRCRLLNVWPGNAVSTGPELYASGSMDRSSARPRNTTIRPSVHLAVHMHYYGGLGLEHDASGIQIASIVRAGRCCGRRQGIHCYEWLHIGCNMCTTVLNILGIV